MTLPDVVQHFISPKKLCVYTPHISNFPGAFGNVANRILEQPEEYNPELLRRLHSATIDKAADVTAFFLAIPGGIVAFSMNSVGGTVQAGIVALAAFIGYQVHSYAEEKAIENFRQGKYPTEAPYVPLSTGNADLDSLI